MTPAEKLAMSQARVEKLEVKVRKATLAVASYDEMMQKALQEVQQHTDVLKAALLLLENVAVAPLGPNPTGSDEIEKWSARLPVDFRRAAPEIYRSCRSSGCCGSSCCWACCCWACCWLPLLLSLLLAAAAAAAAAIAR